MNMCFVAWTKNMFWGCFSHPKVPKGWRLMGCHCFCTKRQIVLACMCKFFRGYVHRKEKRGFNLLSPKFVTRKIAEEHRTKGAPCANWILKFGTSIQLAFQAITSFSWPSTGGAFRAVKYFSDFIPPLFYALVMKKHTFTHLPSPPPPSTPIHSQTTFLKLTPLANNLPLHTLKRLLHPL